MMTMSSIKLKLEFFKIRYYIENCNLKTENGYL